MAERKSGADHKSHRRDDFRVAENPIANYAFLQLAAVLFDIARSGGDTEHSTQEEPLDRELSNGE